MSSDFLKKLPPQGMNGMPPQGMNGMPPQQGFPGNQSGENNDTALISFNSGQPQPPQGAQGMSPDEYAEVYAQQAGISTEEAKAILKEQYGDPQQINGESTQATAMSSGNVSVNANNAQQGNDPNALVSQIAQQSGASEKEVMAFLKEVIGEAQQPNGNQGQIRQDNNPDDLVSQIAQEFGISEEEVKEFLKEALGEAQQQQ